MIASGINGFPVRLACITLAWRPSSRHRSPARFLCFAMSRLLLWHGPSDRIWDRRPVHAPTYAAIPKILVWRKLSPSPIVMQRPVTLAVRLVHNNRPCGALRGGCNRLRTLREAPPDIADLIVGIQLRLIQKFQCHGFPPFRRAVPYRAVVPVPAGGSCGA